ncbi:hypothetical protein FEM48_Zijuj02G0176400 [Ziziphus jujuba var. spinosa]|uniref:Germin-like protein n=1 Tax=Ziziphus jujuba var. spinosa TaxID=714518 RepID=A0A978VX19_ZIZJJ|nr:hypothetical protein FEM48_Zijuj02G0176400 [Ziziphus jujuba var. spinosa]
MQGAYLLLSLVILALASSFASASDPDPVQDFCVALNDTETGVFVNGKFCKDPKDVNADDFFTYGFDVIPGLNTLGISLARIDFAPYGLNPPHTHPRATEILAVLEGTLEVGFVTSNQPDGSKKLFTKILNKGDVFVFPVGLIHFQFNRGDCNALAFAALGSQNPGVITIANAVFGSDPRINPDVLSKAFQVDKNIIDYLQKQFWEDNY